MIWNLKIFVDGRGKSSFQDKYLSSPKFQASFDVRWRFLKKLSREDWMRPEADKLRKGPKGVFKHYYEIRMKEHKDHWRPIGYFGPGAQDFTILVLVREKGNRFDPKEWRTIADNARKRIEDSGGGCVKDFREVDQ